MTERDIDGTGTNTSISIAKLRPLRPHPACARTGAQPSNTTLVNSLAPIGRAWFADVHAELSAPVAIGFRGAFVRCEECSDRDGDIDDDRSATASAYVLNSRKNYAVGGSLNVAVGDDLDDTRSVTSYGAGASLRMGRFDGVRVDVGLSGLANAGGAAVGFFLTARVPLYASTLVRVWIEGRTEIVFPSPTVIFFSGALRARIGAFLLGLHGPLSIQQSSFLVSVGLRL